MKRKLNPGLSIHLFALLAACTVTIGGCSATHLPPARAPNGPDLARGWSVERSGRGLEAFGLPQHARAVPSATADIEPYLQAKRTAPSVRKLDAVVAAKVAAPRPTAEPSKATSLLAVVEPEAAPQVAVLDTSAPTDTEQRYAARDRAAQDQKEFRGGDVIVITAGTIVLVLLILLLVMLVT